MSKQLIAVVTKDPVSFFSLKRSLQNDSSFNRDYELHMIREPKDISGMRFQYYIIGHVPTGAFKYVASSVAKLDQLLVERISTVEELLTH